MCRRSRDQFLLHVPGVNTCDIPDWPIVQNFAYRIVEKLDGCSKVVEGANPGRISITGVLPLHTEAFGTTAMARCMFNILPDWMIKIPEVTCFEPWLTRKPPEWHVDRDGRLCLEFDAHWEQELTEIIDLYTAGLAADYAVSWLLNSTRSLLDRHLFAFRNGITSWPGAWTFWAHGAEAAKHQLRTLLPR